MAVLWQCKTQQNIIIFTGHTVTFIVGLRIKTGVKEMAQQSRAIAALPEDLSLDPSATQAAHSLLRLQFQWI